MPCDLPLNTERTVKNIPPGAGNRDTGAGDRDGFFGAYLVRTAFKE
jgi:hypothetical protein